MARPPGTVLNWAGTSNGYTWDAAGDPPYRLRLHVIGRIHWPANTKREDHIFKANFVPEAGCGPIESATVEVLMPALYLTPSDAYDDPRSPFQPQLFSIVTSPVFTTAGRCRIDIELEGEHLASIPFEVIVLPLPLPLPLLPIPCQPPSQRCWLDNRGFWLGPEVTDLACCGT
jgi:hypothetical protein